MADLPQSELIRACGYTADYPAPHVRLIGRIRNVFDQETGAGRISLVELGITCLLSLHSLCSNNLSWHVTFLPVTLVWVVVVPTT